VASPIYCLIPLDGGLCAVQIYAKPGGNIEQKVTIEGVDRSDGRFLEGRMFDVLAVAEFPYNQLTNKLLSLGSVFSLTSLGCALCLAVGFLAFKRRRKNRRIRLGTLARALFPRRITASPSHSADVGYFFFNVFVFGLVFGWAVLSYQVLTNAVIEGLVGAFGPTQPTFLAGWPARILVTVSLFLAYELGYWIDHYLSHRIPILWEFHKVHHTAHVLTPLTIFRVHPVDGVVNANIIAITMAITNGVVNYALGEIAYQYAVTDRNLIFVLFVHAYLHLQHTHLWIPFTGVLGRVLASPAHHQVHHSTNPIHFNKNLGSCLSIWDWVFGTLHVPNKEPERLTFGIERADGSREDDHAITSRLIGPVWRTFSHVRTMLQR
jgi:sterol desaturase/sphingolipid hydroxylase (fatty acid hydroxylase superfamily)